MAIIYMKSTQFHTFVIKEGISQGIIPCRSRGVGMEALWRHARRTRGISRKAVPGREEGALAWR